MSASPVPTFPYQSPLTPSQELALLAMRRSELSKAVLAKLHQAGFARATRVDFGALVHMGLAIKVGTYHRLTPRGWYEADRIGRDKAKELRLHVIGYDLGGPGRAAKAFCPCGWSTFRSRSIRSYLTSLSADAQHHLNYTATIDAAAAEARPQ